MTGQCYITFFGNTPAEPNYNVIDVDYDSYAITYDCQPTYTFVAFITREAVISEELYDHMVSRTKILLPHFDFSAAMNARDY